MTDAAAKAALARLQALQALMQDGDIAAKVMAVYDAWRAGHLSLAEVGGFLRRELEAGYALASGMVSGDRNARALQVVGVLLLLDPGCARYYQLAGIALQRLKRYELADAYYAMAIHYEPSDPLSLMYRGEVCLYLGRREVGLALLRLGIDLAVGRTELEPYAKRAASIERAVSDHVVIDHTNGSNHVTEDRQRS